VKTFECDDERYQNDGHIDEPLDLMALSDVACMPPGRYRSAGRHSVFAVEDATQACAGFDVSVRQLDAVPVLAVEHVGSHMEIGRAYAVLTHTGPYASMKSAYQWLFGQWLVNSGQTPRSGPMVEEYLNSPRETAPNDLRTRICLPLLAQSYAAPQASKGHP